MTAKADRRDMILKQMFDLLSSLSVPLSTGSIPAGNIVHNRNELPKEMVPGLILLDADEVRDPRTPDLAGRGATPSLSLMRMTPEIYIVLDVRKPQNTNVGDDLNLARAAILGKLLYDPILQELVGGNGTISYDGCVTDLARNRVMQGQMGLSITFVYPFIAAELKPA